MSVGVGITIFMIKQNVRIIGPYVFSGLFTLFPAFLFYGFTSGFSVSEKTMKKQEERRKNVLFDDDGIWYNLPLFDTTLFINWKTIEAVTYTNYQSDDNAKFLFYLTQPAAVTMAEKRFWLNKIFPFVMKNKTEIEIEDDCRNFYEIPKMLSNHLSNTNPIDLDQDHRKGTLISSKTTFKNNTIKTEQYWKPNNNYDREKVIFDKHNRTFEQICQAKRNQRIN